METIQLYNTPKGWIAVTSVNGARAEVTYVSDEKLAHTFVSAHEMLRALLEIEGATELGLNSDNPIHWEASLQDILDTVRPAIAKAEGKGGEQTGLH